MRRAACWVLILAASLPAAALEIDWVRMTGRWPLESAPRVTDLDGDGADEIVAVNRGGQVLLWKADGTPVGKGPDGVAATLPEGQWTSTPARVDTAQGPLVLVCSGKGLVVALGADLKERWQYQLPGETVWAKAEPAVLANNGDPRIGYMDQSGTFTVLKADGSVAWSKPAEDGTGGASAGVVESGFVAPLGATLACFTADGEQRWSTPMKAADGKPVVVRSRPRQVGDGIVCMADNGVVAVVGLDGTPRWQAQLDEELDNTPAILELPGAQPLIAFTGLWGNMHAFTADGHRVWTHLFRSKNRGTPVIADATGTGGPKLVQGTYAQHVLAFDPEGRLVDDLRVNGLVTPSLAPIRDASGRTDVLVATSSLLLYRVRPALPRSPYGETPEPGSIMVTWVWPAPDEELAVRIDNPMGALLAVNAQLDGRYPTWVGALTTRTLVDIPVPTVAFQQSQRNRVEVRDPRTGELVFDTGKVATVMPANSFLVETPHADAWVVDPLDALSPNRRWSAEELYEKPLAIKGLYIGEADQAAFCIGAGKQGYDARVEVQAPARSDGAPFAGVVRLLRVVPVGSLDGTYKAGADNTEMVPDALVPLGAGEAVAVPAEGVAKLWVSVDARGAEAGAYEGKVAVTAAGKTVKELPFRIEVLPLAMPERFPLTLCTWDYVPNKWFPEGVAGEALDDMQRHGVNVFPRNAAPDATVDASGALRMDWTKLDAELDRLQGRGQILFHLGHPAIAFATPPADDAKRAAELAYLRAFCKHLEERGLGYDDWAMYPVDEPGLDYRDGGVIALLDTGALFEEADPNIRLYTDPVPTLAWEFFEQIAPTIDVWCPNMRQVTGLLAQDPRIRAMMDSGVPVWSYECVAQVKSLSPLRYNRANAWRAWYFGLDGIGFWTHSQNQKSMWDATDDEYGLVYPGDLPVPSARWESVRDGLEDVAAMALLEEAIAQARAKGAPAEAVAKAENVLRLAKNDVMELSDPAFVESRDFLAKGDRRIWHSRADIDTYRRHRAAIAQATLSLR